MSHLRPLARLSAAAPAALLLLAWAPGPANASHETIARAVGHIVQSPLDLALSPIVAWATLNTNIRDIDDTTAVRVAYYLPGYFWLLGVQVGASVIRGVTGGLEFLPGLFLIPFPNTELDRIYDPVERGAALVEYENDIIDVKFGINYQSPAY